MSPAAFLTSWPGVALGVCGTLFLAAFALRGIRTPRKRTRALKYNKHMSILTKCNDTVCPMTVSRLRAELRRLPAGACVTVYLDLTLREECDGCGRPLVTVAEGDLDIAGVQPCFEVDGRTGQKRPAAVIVLETGPFPPRG